MTLSSDNQDKERQEKRQDGCEEGAAQVVTGDEGDTVRRAQVRRYDGGIRVEAHRYDSGSPAQARGYDGGICVEAHRYDGSCRNQAGR